MLVMITIILTEAGHMTAHKMNSIKYKTNHSNKTTKTI